MTKIEKSKSDRIYQGDLFHEIEHIFFTEKPFKFIFPLVIVLTQDCDLQQDLKYRNKQEKSDKRLLSIIVAPLYNYEQFISGNHLEELQGDLEGKISPFPNSKSLKNYLKNNQLQRHHYLNFNLTSEFPPSIIDFKHYFAIDVDVLLKQKTKQCGWKVQALHRETITQRFANFLSRIGLPSPQVEVTSLKDSSSVDIEKRPPPL